MSDGRLYTVFHKPTLPELKPGALLAPVITLSQGVAGVTDGLAAFNMFDPFHADLAFAEMRVQYLVWKGKRRDWVGFQHYRRMFLTGHLDVLSGLEFGGSPFLLAPAQQFCAYAKAVSDDQERSAFMIEGMLEKFPVITGMPWSGFGWNIEEQFLTYHSANDWMMFQAALEAIGFPVTDVNQFYSANMYILRWDEFDRYMRLWYQVMVYLLRWIKPQRGTGQERIFGFLSERLWSLWVHYLSDWRPEVQIARIPRVICDELKVL